MRYTDASNKFVHVEAARNTWDTNPSDCTMPVEMLEARGLDVSDVEAYQEFPDVASARAAAHKRLSARRDAAIENFTFAGMPIKLTPETRANITGAILGVTVGQTQPVHWQISPTQFIDLTAQQILALGIATHAHVEACFTNTRTLAALVEASDDPLSVDIEIGWP